MCNGKAYKLMIEFIKRGKYMSFNYKTNMSQQEILQKSTAHLKALGYHVNTKGYVLEATDGRDYTTWIAVVLFLFFFIPFLIYWFTRKKNKIIVDASTPGVFVLTYDGSKAVIEAERLANMFKA